MYPRILQPAYARVDRPIMDCQDVFKYDAKADRFIFGDSVKVAGTALRGARMVYDNKLGTVQAEGPLKLGTGLDYMKITGAGRLKSDFNNVTDSTGYTVTGEFMTGMELNVPKILLDIMANDIQASGFDAPAVVTSTNLAFYQPALSEFVTDEKERAEALGNLANNLVALPKNDNKYTILLGRHAVLWNAEYQSFLSTEDKIPLLGFNNQLVGKMLTTYVEYKMPGNEDDRFYIYLKASPDLWYFFGYQTGAMNVVSSSTRFNDALLALKPKETVLKMPDGETYEIVAANPSVADAFVNRVRAGRTKQ